jgi:hypothetical protein
MLKYINILLHESWSDFQTTRYVCCIMSAFGVNIFLCVSLGHFLGQLSQTQNWTVLSSTCIQHLVFHCWERLHTVNMETTGRNILSQYELPKETHRKMLNVYKGRSFLYMTIIRLCIDLWSFRSNLIQWMQCPRYKLYWICKNHLKHWLEKNSSKLKEKPFVYIQCYVHLTFMSTCPFVLYY